MKYIVIRVSSQSHDTEQTSGLTSRLEIHCKKQTNKKQTKNKKKEEKENEKENNYMLHSI